MKTPTHEITYLGFDCETTGTDPYAPVPAGLLEIGLIAFNHHLEPITSFQSLVASPKAAAHRAAGVDPVVEAMHHDNGLWAEIEAADRAALTPQKVERDALDWMEREGVPHGLPMLGSSITLDRSFLAAELPNLHAKFHYRSVDATSFLLVAEHSFGVSKESIYQRVPGAAAHRVLDDIERSAQLLKAGVDVLRSAQSRDYSAVGSVR